MSMLREVKIEALVRIEDGMTAAAARDAVSEALWSWIGKHGIVEYVRAFEKKAKPVEYEWDVVSQLYHVGDGDYMGDS